MYFYDEKNDKEYEVSPFIPKERVFASAMTRYQFAEMRNVANEDNEVDCDGYLVSDVKQDTVFWQSAETFNKVYQPLKDIQLVGGGVDSFSTLSTYEALCLIEGQLKTQYKTSQEINEKLNANEPETLESLLNDQSVSDAEIVLFKAEKLAEKLDKQVVKLLKRVRKLAGISQSIRHLDDEIMDRIEEKDFQEYQDSLAAE